MGADYKPSTRRLFKLVGWEERYSYTSEEDETYQVHCVVVELGNRAYVAKAWVAGQAAIDSLREALADNSQSYAGTSLAYALVKSGCRQPQTMASLDAWDALMFKWNSEGLTAGRVISLLQEAGIAIDLPAKRIDEINVLIADPPSALGKGLAIPYLLLEGPVQYASLRDICFTPEHHSLFEKLAHSAIPPVPVRNVRQSLDSEERFVDVSDTTELSMQTADGPISFRFGDHPQFSREGVKVLSASGAHWVIQYDLDSSPHAFFAEARGTWMDVGAVTTNFNQLMTTLGRSERAFRFADGREDSGEFGGFIVADSGRFPELARRLHMPLHQDE